MTIDDWSPDFENDGRDGWKWAVGTILAVLVGAFLMMVIA